MIKCLILIISLAVMMFPSAIFAEEVNTHEFKAFLYDTVREYVNIPDKDIKKMAELLFLTAAVESDFGTGPHCKKHGVFQLMPITENAVLATYDKNKKKKMLQLKQHHHRKYEATIVAEYYMMRIKTFKKALPNWNDRRKQSEVWKVCFNTYLGKGTVNYAMKKIAYYDRQHEHKKG